MRYLRLLLALAAALLGLSVLAGTAATAGATPPATGSLEICKVAAPPLAGQTFPFLTATCVRHPIQRGFAQSRSASGRMFDSEYVHRGDKCPR